MMPFNKFLLTAARLTAAALLLLTGCVETDDMLGGNLMPDDQQMKMGFVTLPRLDAEGGPDLTQVKEYVETRLYRTDSIRTSNISNGYLGTHLNDTLGSRTAGFLSQFQSYYLVPEGYFGFRPVFDSVRMMLSISAYGRDTLTEQHFAVYEVLSNDYLTADDRTDTTFYLNFDPDDPKLKLYDPSRKLFTFTLGGDKGPSTTSVTMLPTDEGRAFIGRLMLQEGEYAGKYSIYSRDSLEYWHQTFRGLYICPDPDAPLEKKAGASDCGTIYATSLENSGFTVYGRNRVEEDPSLVKDTVGIAFYFYDSESDYGNVSVNAIRRSYDTSSCPALATAEQAWESSDSRPKVSSAYVEGLGGAVTELRFTSAFFDEMEELLRQENLATGKNFRSLAFSQVRMQIYFTESDYDWRKMDPSEGFAPATLVEEMNDAPARLGLYTDYKKLTPITDYAYYYEQTYDVTLAYGGYINRSRGCYVMNITGHVQTLWNNYLKEKEAAESEGRPIDPERIEGRTLYLGPQATALYSMSFGICQGSSADPAADGLKAPIRFDITYNMVK